MCKSPYFDILNTLASEIGKDVDVSEKVKSLFSNGSENDNYWDNRTIDAEKLLSQMKANGHIDYQSILLDEIKGIPVRPTKFTASITALGYDFYKQHKNIFWTRVMAWIALVISLVSAFFSGWQAFNNDKQSPYKTPTQSQVNKQSHQR